MAKDKENKLTITGIEDKALAELPDFIKEDAGKGGLETGAEMVFGFAKLLDAKSPEVEAVDSKFKSGEIINSLSVASYGRELTFIPLVDQKQAIRWVPRSEGGGGMDCVSQDLMNGNKHGECIKCEFNYDLWKDPSITKDNKKGLCSTYLNFPSLINGEDMPTILAFWKTKYKVGQRIKALYVNKCASLNKTVPIYAMKFKLISIQDKAGADTFWNYDVSFAGFVTDAAEYTKAKKWAEMIKNINIKTEKTPF